MKSKQDFQPGDTVELAHKETSFVDSETGFEITTTEKKKLGDRIGKATHRALVSGALLVVSGGKKGSKE